MSFFHPVSREIYQKYHLMTLYYIVNKLPRAFREKIFSSMGWKVIGEVSNGDLTIAGFFSKAYSTSCPEQ